MRRGGGPPCFTRSFNDCELEDAERFFHSLFGKKFFHGLDDKLSLKEAKDGIDKKKKQKRLRMVISL